MLDEITDLYYNNDLSINVSGDTRNSVINSFRNVKGVSYVPSSLHPSLKWTESDPMPNPKKLTNPQKISCPPNANQKATSPFIPAIGMKSLVTKKCKTNPVNDHNHITKKPCANHFSPSSPLPNQVTWHQNSCGYDSAFTILYSLWCANHARWTQYFNETNPQFLGLLAQNFQQVANNAITINDARDNLRYALAYRHPNIFAVGQFVNLDNLLDCILETPFTTIQTELTCEESHTTIIHTMPSCLITLTNLNGRSLQTWINNSHDTTQQACPTCHKHRTRQIRLLHPTPLLAFEFPAEHTITDPVLTIAVYNQPTQYTLKGIIYFGHSHFTSQIILNDNSVWYHDGMTTGHKLLYHGQINIISDLMKCQGRQACAAIYVANQTSSP